MKFNLRLQQSLTWVLGMASGLACAQTHYVSATDATCGGSTPCYTTIQAAVDAAADGDEILVAKGTYEGTHKKTASDGYDYYQVVFIEDKSLTLKGGYTAGNWTFSDPVANPTVIDAQGYGRAITILGEGTPYGPPYKTVVIKGFQLINGDYTELGAAEGEANTNCSSRGSDCGGGLMARQVNIELIDDLIQDNVAGRTRNYPGGGGFFLWKPGQVLIENSLVVNNGSHLGYGGGGRIEYPGGGITVRNSEFTGNRAGDCGGLDLLSAKTTLIEDSRFLDNQAIISSADGSALCIANTEGVTLRRLEFLGNRAPTGVALYLYKVGSDDPPQIVMENLLLADNQATEASTNHGVVELGGHGIEVQARHLTVKGASSSAPAALYLANPYNSDDVIDAQFTNTLITDLTYGFMAKVTGTGAVDVNRSHTLFGSAAIVRQYALEGAPTFTATDDKVGAPALNSLHRLTAGSPAVDAGTDAAVTNDLDGDPRPSGTAPDIGADEYKTNVVGLYRFSHSAYAGDEGTDLTITVERIGEGLGTTTVDYATSDGSAGSSDYTSASGRLTFAAGEYRKTFTLSLTDDDEYDPQETIWLTLSAPSSGTDLGEPARALVTINDTDTNPAGVLTFAQETTEVDEGAGTARVTVIRQGSTQGEVTVDYATASSYPATATEGSDYQPASGTLTFADGQATQSFEVTIVDDNAVEPEDETIKLSLTNATGGATLGDRTLAWIAIKDNDDHGSVAFASAQYLVQEDAGSITLEVRRTGGALGQVTVDYTTQPDTARDADYTAANGRLTFDDGETSKTLTLQITDDALAEGNEAFQVVLSNPVGGVRLAAPQQTQVTIVDDESCSTSTARYEVEGPSEFSGEYYCAASEWVKLGNYRGVANAPVLRVRAGALLILSAQVIELYPNFAVERGGRLRAGNGIRP